MREYTVRFWLPGGDLFAFSEEFATEPAIERGKIHRMKVLGDGGTATMLNECTGPAEAVQRALERSEKVLDVTATGEETTFYYVHFEPSDLVRDMMEGRRSTTLALNMPLDLRTDGSIVASYVGDQSVLQDTFDLIPEAVEAELVRVEDGVTGQDGTFATLTGRQREVLSVAIEQGYYETPRAATQGDVAAELDVSAATVGEHLRKIEAQVLGSFDG
jgi:hypothetical protein